jgi:hypothetical protein
MVSVWEDPLVKSHLDVYDAEWPADATLPLYTKLVDMFFDQPHVLFAFTNEPHGPADKNAELAKRYVKAIDTIRAAEAAHGSRKHIVVVQAPEGWARDLSYFVSNPLAGENIAYEIHPYNPKSDFDKLIVQPSKTLPIIIGEYAPISGIADMSNADVQEMWAVAKANHIPHIAWNFHMRCPPDMLQDTAKDGCGLAASMGYTFPRTAWGNLFHDYLATPW